MRYLEVEDTRIRDYLKKEIINTIIGFANREKIISMGELDNYNQGKDFISLSSNNDSSNLLYESTLDDILDTMESEKLISAISYLEDDEIDLLTRLYVNGEDEFEIALDKKMLVKDVHISKLRILDTIRQNVNNMRE